MRYGYTILYVDKVKETLDFYQKAFGFKRKFLTPKMDYGELLSGETTIAFAATELGHSNLRNGFIKSNETEKPFGAEMVFVTENVESDFRQALQMGAIEVEPLTEKPWGQRVGYVKDNNGFLIEICTAVEKE